MQEKKEKNKYDRPNSTMKRVRFEDDLLEQINAVVKDENSNFSAWVKNACREKISRNSK